MIYALLAIPVACGVGYWLGLRHEFRRVFAQGLLRGKQHGLSLGRAIAKRKIQDARIAHETMASWNPAPKRDAGGRFSS